MKEKILITGASGTLAKKVRDNFENQGLEVISLTSNKKKADGRTTFFWDTSNNLL